MESTVSLNGLDEVRYGDSICFLFDDKDDYRLIISNFIADGLTHNEKVLFVNEEYPYNLLIEDLEGRDIDVKHRIETGQLTIVNNDYIYINKYRFDIDTTINNWKLQLKDLKKMNYSGFRAVCDMVFAANGSQEMLSKLMEYESIAHTEINSFYENQIIMCVYNKLRFSNYVLEDMIEKHSVAINNKDIYNPNPFYIGDLNILIKYEKKYKLREQFSLYSKFKPELIDFKEEIYLDTLKNVLRVTGDGVWELDLETLQLNVSDSFYKITGYKMGMLEKSPNKFLDIINPNDKEDLKSEFEKCCKHQTKYFEYETKVLKNNNEWVWLLIKGVPIISDVTNGRVLKLIGTFNNITQSIMYKFELEEKESYERMRTDFFANVSHELRTPLAVILGSLQLQEYLIDCDTFNLDAYKKHIDTVKVNGYRLLRLVNNIIDITRIESRFLGINLGNYAIDSLIEKIVVSVEDFAKKHNLSLIFNSNIESVIIACDPEKIERIILNLLSNAIKFTRSGGSVVVNIDKDENYIIIKIKDNGVGIPKDKIKNIFERFVQANNSKDSNSHGSGIGLSLVQALVKIHDGDISVDSEIGKGTEFTIRLPNRIVSPIKGEGINSSNWELDEERMNIEFSDIV